MADLAQENVETVQQTQKKYHDRSARDRSFEPGDQVLLLLPTSPRKLDAAWQGPFRVLRKLGPVDYEIELEGRRKKRRVVHVNMLKKRFLPLTLASRGMSIIKRRTRILKSLQKLSPLLRKILVVKRASAPRSATNSQQTRSRNNRLFSGSSTTYSATTLAEPA